MTPVLHYDQSCPVCRTFAKAVQKLVPPGGIELRPIENPEDSKDFRFTDALGMDHYGNDAVKALYESFPSTASAFAFLPDKYQEMALQLVYKVGSLMRTVVNRVRNKGCGC